MLLQPVRAPGGPYPATSASVGPFQVAASEMEISRVPAWNHRNLRSTGPGSSAKLLADASGWYVSFEVLMQHVSASLRPDLGLWF